MNIILRTAEKARRILKNEGVKGIVFRLLARVRDSRRRGDDFDARYGVDTDGDIALWRLSIPSEDWTSGVHYRGIAEEVFRSCMDRLPIDPNQYTFIDLGSGKGRALILAHKLQFRRIIGVEFSPQLCKDATRNLARMGIEAEIECKSATEFIFPQERSVIFMYNPFGADIVERVLGRLHPDGYLVYVNPRFAALIPFPAIYQSEKVLIFKLGGRNETVSYARREDEGQLGSN